MKELIRKYRHGIPMVIYLIVYLILFFYCGKDDGEQLSSRSHEAG